MTYNTSKYYIYIFNINDLVQTEEGVEENYSSLDPRPTTKWIHSGTIVSTSLTRPRPKLFFVLIVPATPVPPSSPSTRVSFR